MTSAWAPEHGWENPAPNEHAGKLRTPELLSFSSPLCWNHCFNAAANKSGKVLDCSRMFYTQPLLADLPDTLPSQASGKLALLGLPLGCIYQSSQGSKPEAPFKNGRHLATGKMGQGQLGPRAGLRCLEAFLYSATIASHMIRLPYCVPCVPLCSCVNTAMHT